MREYGSEHPAIVLPDGYFESLSETKRELIYLRSGRESLLLAALTLKHYKENKTSDLKILFPAYCCWSMSAPFEKAGWKIVYYRLNDDLTVDIDFLKQLLEIETPDAVLTMNYFGIAFTDDIVRVVRDYEKKTQDRIFIIEDFSHCTFSLKQIYNTEVDIYVSSIRKSIGVCDGAIILSNIPLKRDLIQNSVSDFADIRYMAQVEKGHYKWNNDQKKKESFLKNIQDGESIINSFNEVRPISERALKMLKLLNGEEIAYARRENMFHLIQLLKGKVRMVSYMEKCLNGAPFSLPILVEDRDKIQYKLAKTGVYAPVLWPICKEAQHVCNVSRLMSEHMLSIPIDQRYDWYDMELIAERILNILK